MDKKIYLVRHGEIDYGREKRYIGATDLPLSNTGREQIVKLKEFFLGIKLEKAYISPLIRCIQTSEILLEGRNIEKNLLEELKEINMGAWENQPMGYIKSHFREQYDDRGDNIDVFYTAWRGKL